MTLTEIENFIRRGSCPLARTTHDNCETCATAEKIVEVVRTALAERDRLRAALDSLRVAVANSDAIYVHERAGAHTFCNGCDLAQLLRDTQETLRLVPDPGASDVVLGPARRGAR